MTTKLYEFEVPGGYHEWSTRYRDNFVRRLREGKSISQYAGESYDDYLSGAYPPKKPGLNHDGLAAVDMWERSYTEDAMLLAMAKPGQDFSPTCRPIWMESNPGKLQTCPTCNEVGL